jgi:threonine dehydratase/serine racemase
VTGVGAGVFEREELVAHAKQADFDPAHGDSQRRPRRQRARFGHPYKGHGFSTAGASARVCASGYLVRRPMTTSPPDLLAVREAAARIAGLAHRTPVATCKTLDRMAGVELFFKCEHLQKTGAFKFRGACNAVRKLSAELAERGVVTHSSGNHAGAIALAARLRGIPALVVMPTTASAAKRRAVEGYGARVIECEPTQESREATATALVEQSGGTLIPPYDHPDVIAGQGTTALELIEQVPRLDAIVAPIGGGGLVSGVCIAARGVAPGVRVFAAEPKAADDAARSKAANRRIPWSGPPATIADGLLTSLGALTWPVVRDCVERVTLVTEEEIVQAMRLLWERAKLLVEPSAAVALAAVLGDEFRALPGLRRVGIVLSGGNVDLERLPF